MISLLIFFLTLTHVTSLSFNFKSFDPSNHSIKYEGNASALDSIIQLTSNQTVQTGHATYKELMQLWDNSSGILADFTTNFSFSIDAQNRALHADGFTFFMAPMQYRMPEQDGGGLGLASGNLILNSIANPFVAIEFDTFYSPWDDMEDDHVGININSLKSLKSLEWSSSVMDGRIMDARISYNSSFKNLCVYYTQTAENVIVEQNLCYQVDLRNYLPEWVILGFSAATGTYSEFHRIHSWSFESNFQIRQNTTNPSLPPTNQFTNLSPPSTTNPISRRKGKNRAGLVIGVVVGAVMGAIILVLVGLGWFWHYNKKKKSRTEIEIYPNNPTIDGDSFTTQSQDNEFKRVTGPKNIPHEVLVCATNNFDEKEKLGEGGFGSVFKGYLKDLDIFVAVKRISESSIQGISEYAAEVMILSQLRHRNLVLLIGWCHEKKEILLVYEWLPNRSLDFHLFDKEKLLKWEQRYKIAKGLACGLHYLHEGWRQCVLHRDIKSSNVMLDSDFNAMLGDFGLATIIDHDARSQTLQGGSHGYIAPECLDTGKSSKESDVFSFGVVALEIACGRKPFVQRVDGSQVHIVKWVWELYEDGQLLKAADEKLHGNFTKKEMECLMIVGLWSAHPDLSFRPSMREAINVLNFDVELPDLLSKLPGPTHCLPLPTQRTSISSSVIPEQLQPKIQVTTCKLILLS